MTHILDGLYITSLERKGLMLSPDDLAYALDNDGYLSVRHNGQYIHIQIPVLRFPEDLLAEIGVDND